MWVADPQISPDGTQVAFVRVNVNAKKNYETSIWLDRPAADAPQRSSDSSRDSSPRWSPDGRRLAFVRAAEKETRVQPPQIYICEVARRRKPGRSPIFRAARRTRLVPRRANDRLLVHRTPAELAAKDRDQNTDEKARAESDVRVITEAVYRANGVPGSGYRRSRPAQRTSGRPGAGRRRRQADRHRVTGEFAVGNRRGPPDGSQIYFVSDRPREAYYLPATATSIPCRRTVANQGASPASTAASAPTPVAPMASASRSSAR